MAIRPLPEDVASRIAAGEVIERPASVLKELIENSIDAGAGKITVEITGAGRKLIRIADDGEGLAPADCRAAFARHTTSKISRLADIESLSTFGFRGEALFSIAAVSETALTSTPRGKRRAWKVEIKGGRLAKESEAPSAGGTVIEVRRLFFNTPARAKFLKSDAAERGHLARVIEEAALANPGVGFTYKSEGRTVHRFAPQKHVNAASRRKRVAEVLGAEHGDVLLAAELDRGGLSVRAFISPADSLRSSRALQYCFINRRPITSRTVQQALYRAYEPFRPKNRHPAAVILLELSPERLDVNVHPTKREVRFRKDAAVFETITKAVSKTLLQSKGIPTLSAPDRATGAEKPPHWAPMSPELRYQAGGRRHTFARDGSPAYAAQERLAAGPRAAAPAQRPWFAESLRYLGQIERAYLVFEAEGGLLVVDQHAAQERILFERYLKEAEAGKPPVQRLMLPLPIDLPASGINHILARKKRLARAGFEIEARGKTSLQVLSVPSVFHQAKDIKEMVYSLLDSLLSPESAAAGIRHDATATIACKASVKAHDPLSRHEALRLIEDMRKCEDGTCCPHGRPTMLSLDRDELARRFKRSGAPPL